MTSSVQDALEGVALQLETLKVHPPCQHARRSRATAESNRFVSFEPPFDRAAFYYTRNASNALPSQAAVSQKQLAGEDAQQSVAAIRALTQELQALLQPEREVAAPSSAERNARGSGAAGPGSAHPPDVPAPKASDMQL